MKLQDYLTAIRECPDGVVNLQGRKINRLAAEFGIYDNYVIFLGASLLKLTQGLRSNQLFNFKKAVKRGNYITDIKYDSEKINLQLGGHFPIGLATHISDTNPQNAVHFRCQERFTKSFIVLHPGYMSLEDSSWPRVMAHCIQDIGDHIRSKSSKFACFPNSIGWRSLNDLSQIVYYPDAIDDEIQRRTAIFLKGEEK